VSGSTPKRATEGDFENASCLRRSLLDARRRKPAGVLFVEVAVRCQDGRLDALAVPMARPAVIKRERLRWMLQVGVGLIDDGRRMAPSPS